MTELHLAAAYGNPEICARILDEGAPVDLFESAYGTPLCAAASSKKSKIGNVKLLLQRGANVNAEDETGSTALFYAALRGNIELIDLLLRGGANIAHENRRGRTVLHEVAASSEIAAARLLLERHAKVLQKCAAGMTPLHIAVQGPNLEMVQILLENGAQVDEEGPHGCVPLHVAVISGNLSMIELLLAGGAHVDAPSSPRLPPLFHAVLSDNVDIAQFLLDKGARISCGNTTLFHAAAEMGLSTMMGVLLQHVAQQEAGNLALINQMNDEGKSPLHIAAQKGDLETVRVLIEANADIDIKDETSKTPLYYATSHENDNVRNFLLGRGAKPTMPSIRTATVELEDGNIIEMSVQFEFGKDVQMTNDELATMLHKVLEEQGQYPSPIKQISIRASLPD